MPSLISRLRAAAIGFSAPHIIARGAAGIRLDAVEKTIAEVREDLHRGQRQSAEDARFAASNAFEASWRAVLGLAKTETGAGSTYQAGIVDAASAIVRAKTAFLGEHDAPPLHPHDDQDPRPGLCLAHTGVAAMTSTGKGTNPSETSETDQAMIHVDTIASQTARALMLHIAEKMPDRDEVEDLVERCCQEFLEGMVTEGIDPVERDLALKRYRRSLIAEGGRISRLLVWDGGTA